MKELNDSYCEEENNNFRLNPLLEISYYCEEDENILYPLHKNTLWIYSDSVRAGNIDSLKSLSISEAFILQYQNSGKNPKLADNPHRIFIRVMLDEDENITMVKNILEELIIVFLVFEIQENLFQTLESILAKPNNKAHQKNTVIQTLHISFEIPIPPPLLPISQIE